MPSECPVAATVSESTPCCPTLMGTTVAPVLDTEVRYPFPLMVCCCSLASAALPAHFSDRLMLCWMECWLWRPGQQSILHGLADTWPKHKTPWPAHTQPVIRTHMPKRRPRHLISHHMTALLGRSCISVVDCLGGRHRRPSSRLRCMFGIAKYCNILPPFTITINIISGIRQAGCPC